MSCNLSKSSSQISACCLNTLKVIWIQSGCVKENRCGQSEQTKCVCRFVRSLRRSLPHADLFMKFTDSTSQQNSNLTISLIIRGIQHLWGSAEGGHVCHTYLSSSSFSLKAALKTLILSIKGLQSCFRSSSTLCTHTDRRTHFTTRLSDFHSHDSS